MSAPISIVTAPDWRSVRLADHRRDDDRPIAEANERGRLGALGELEALVPDLPIGSLAQTTDSGTFKVGRAAPILRDLFDADAMLDQILTWGDLHGQQLELVREQHRPGPTDYLVAAGPARRSRARVAELAAFIEEGYTVVLNGVELRDRASMRLAEATERVFGTTVNINGYLSRRPPMSFGAHWDDQETIILQLLGHKAWVVEEPRSLSMVRNVHGSETSGKVVWEGVLEPGSSLYVPRGWGHRVNSVDDLSYHYTVTIPRVNGIRLLETIVGSRAPRETGARTLPMAAGEAAFEDLGLDASDARVQAALALSRAQISSRTTQELSVVLRALRGETAGLWVRCPFPGGWIAVPDAEPGFRRIAAAGFQYEVAEELLQSVLRWADGLGRPWPDDDEACAVVETLVRLNVLEVTDDPPAWGFPMFEVPRDLG